MTHRWSLVAVLLATTVVLAGCTKDEDPPAGTTTTTPPTGTTTTTTPTPGGNSTPPPPPAQAPVQDAGDIQGPFTKEWTIPVPLVSPRVMTVLFNLTGIQADAPPTASLHLEFVLPDGTIAKSTGVGVGGAGNTVAWTFSAADLPQTGDHKVRATANPNPAGGPPLPSGGVGKYQFYALVEY